MAPSGRPVFTEVAMPSPRGLISLKRRVAVDAAIGDVRDNQVPSVLLQDRMSHATSQLRLLEKLGRLVEADCLLR